MRSAFRLIRIVAAFVIAAAPVGARGQIACPDMALQPLLDWYGSALARDSRMSDETIRVLRIRAAIAALPVLSPLSGDAGRQLEASKRLLAEKLRFLYCEHLDLLSEPAGVDSDRDHVVFVIDTSGSMRRYAWDRVVRQVSEILAAYPALEGFQVLNDDGIHLLETTSGDWISNTATNRTEVLQRLAAWTPTSDSTSYQGIIEAIDRYYDPTRNIALHVLGDDETFERVDVAARRIIELNRRADTGEPKIQINASQFPVMYEVTGSMLGGEQFTQIMYVLARSSGGTVIGLPADR